MTDYEPKELYVQKLVDDIENAANDSYRAGGEWEELKEAVAFAKQRYDYLKEAENELRKLYYYLMGEEYVC